MLKLNQNKSEIALSAQNLLKWLISFIVCVTSILLLFSKYHFSLHIGAKEHSLLAALLLFGVVISFIRLLGCILKTSWLLFWAKENKGRKLKAEQILSALFLSSIGLTCIYFAIKGIFNSSVLFVLSRHVGHVSMVTSPGYFWVSVVFLILFGLFLCGIPAFGYFKMKKSALTHHSSGTPNGAP